MLAFGGWLIGAQLLALLGAPGLLILLRKFLAAFLLFCLVAFLLLYLAVQKAVVVTECAFGDHAACESQESWVPTHMDGMLVDPTKLSAWLDHGSRARDPWSHTWIMTKHRWVDNELVLVERTCEAGRGETYPTHDRVYGNESCGSETIKTGRHTGEEWQPPVVIVPEVVPYQAPLPVQTQAPTANRGDCRSVGDMTVCETPTKTCRSIIANGQPITACDAKKPAQFDVDRFNREQAESDLRQSLAPRLR